MTALGVGDQLGNLSTAQSAFATVQSEFKTTPSQAIANAESAVAQTVQWVDDLLSLANSNTTSTTPVGSGDFNSRQCVWNRPHLNDDEPDGCIAGEQVWRRGDLDEFNKLGEQQQSQCKRRQPGQRSQRERLRVGNGCGNGNDGLRG